jgi:hypothetical protein
MKKRQTQTSIAEDTALIIQKKGGDNINDAQNHLRNVIQEEANKMEKPFSKKYISSRNIQSKSQ